MPQGDVETFCRDGRWCNRIAGEGVLPAEYEDKEPAVEVGRLEAMLRQGEHIIRGLDGMTTQHYYYGSAPHVPS